LPPHPGQVILNQIRAGGVADFAKVDFDRDGGGLNPQGTDSGVNQGLFRLEGFGG
jgi:hypothetical protein